MTITDADAAQASAEAALELADQIVTETTDDQPTNVDITGEASTQEVAEVQAALETAPTGPTDDDIIAGLLGSIKPVAEMSPFLRVAIFGDPGVRKTSFAATAPKPLMYEVDFGGAKSLLNHTELAKTRVMQFKSMYQFRQLLRFLTDDHEAFADVETLVIDTYSGLEQKSLKTFPVLSDGKPDYNQNSNQMKELTDLLRQVKKHVVITCHTKEEKDGESGRILRRPDMTPGIAKVLNGMFDIIGFMDVQEDSWTLRLQKSGPYSAKSRVGGLPDVMENPNFSTILNAYNKMRTAASN